MPAVIKSASKELVLSPKEALTAGGPAEQLEQQIKASYRNGIEQVFVDLRHVSSVDSAGIRALVRGHTTALRLGRRFAVVKPNDRVRDVLHLSKLDDVLQVCDTVAIARSKPWPWPRIVSLIAVAVVGVGLVVAGLIWPSLGFAPPLAPAAPGLSPFSDQPAGPALWSAPLFEFSKLVVAAIVGMLVTVVHRQYRAERELNPTMEQAQVLLCISGALMMIIIGNNLARAFGIAGAASIIRFRTPVEDPKDITVLFILMGLGMASGLGGFALAGLGTLFLCAMLPILNQFSTAKPRMMLVEIEADRREFPFDHVQHVFAVHRVEYEPREVSQGDDATVRYLTTLRGDVSLEELSAQLLGDGKQGIQNVSWSVPKRA